MSLFFFFFRKANRIHFCSSVKSEFSKSKTKSSSLISLAWLFALPFCWVTDPWLSDLEFKLKREGESRGIITHFSDSQGCKFGHWLG